jgi:cytochrome bd-type quinol oxidase subunit 1
MSVLTVLLYTLQYFAFQHLGIEFTPIYYSFYGFLILATLLSHVLIMKQLDKRPQLFVTYFMGSMTVKLFFALAIMLLAIWFNRAEKYPLAIVFMVLYFAFTFLSISAILPHLNSGKNSDKR